MRPCHLSTFLHLRILTTQSTCGNHAAKNVRRGIDHVRAISTKSLALHPFFQGMFEVLCGICYGYCSCSLCSRPAVCLLRPENGWSMSLKEPGCLHTIENYTCTRILLTCCHCATAVSKTYHVAMHYIQTAACKCSKASSTTKIPYIPWAALQDIFLPNLFLHIESMIFTD